MTALRQIQTLSEADYLAAENDRPDGPRHEYLDGYIQAMAGGTWAHTVIAANVLGLLHRHLENHPCVAFGQDFRVRVEVQDRVYHYYPDAVVTCHPNRSEAYFTRHPTLIVEVLSPSTECIDRREKLFHYKAVPSLEEYALVDQEKPEVTVFRRAESWMGTIYGPDDTVEFRSVGLSVPVRRLYLKAGLA